MSTDDNRGRLGVLGRIAAALLAVAVVGALGYVVVYAVRAVVASLAAPGEPAGSVVRTAWLLLLSLALVAVLALRRVSERSRLDRLRAERGEVYRRFLETWAASFAEGDRVERRGSPQQTLEEAHRDLLLVAGRGVLRQYARCRRAAGRAGLADPEVRAGIERVLVEIRRDLGCSSVLLERGDLLELFVDAGRPADAAATGGAVATGRSTRREGLVLTD